MFFWRSRRVCRSVYADPRSPKAGVGTAPPANANLRHSAVPESSGLPLRTRVARSIFWLAWSRGVVQLLTFATTVLVARILAPADYGVMALAGVFIATSSVLTEMGLGTAIVQFRDLDSRQRNTGLGVPMTLAACAYACLSLR